jgi:hypothetical protein
MLAASPNSGSRTVVMDTPLLLGFFGRRLLAGSGLLVWLELGAELGINAGSPFAGATIGGRSRMSK